MRSFIAAVSMLLASGSFALPAFGGTENEEAAQAAYDEALKLMKQKRYGEACAHLARSQDLDPAMGTQFRLAECYEKLGRNASAYDQYMLVAEAAKEAKQAQRESVARARAATLEAKIARLTIDLSPSVASLAGVEIRRDGVSLDKRLWGQSQTIDLGDHVVTVQAAGKHPFERKFWADASAKLVISVAALDEKKTEQSASRSKIPAFVMGGVGLAGIAAGITFVVLRSNQITEAQNLSKQIVRAGANCRADGPAEFTTQCDTLLTMAQTGDRFGTLSIVGFSVGGAALLGMGAYLLWPESKPRDDAANRIHIVPVLGPNSTGFVAAGVF